MGRWKMQPGGCVGSQGLPCSGGSVRAAKRRQAAGLGEATSDSPTLPRAAENPQLCPLAAAGHATWQGQAAGHPAFCPAPEKQQRGKQGGWNCSSEKDLSDQGPFSFSRIGTSIFPAPAAWTAPVISWLCFQTGQARRSDPGCEVNLAVHRGWGRGERGNPLSGEMRACSPKWGPRNQLWSEEQLVSWAEQGTSQRALCYSNTGWSGKVKASNTLKQKTPAGTKGSKTHILQRWQPAPQEMQSIWPNKSTQSSYSSCSFSVNY